MKRQKDQGGLTLVELMVGTALGGILVIAMIWLFIYSRGREVSSRNQSDLSEKLGQFSQMLEVYLTNATEIRACGCNRAGECVYDPAVDCVRSPASCVAPLVDFITEDSLDPGAFAGADCHEGTPNPRVSTTPPRLPPRGCKKRIQVLLVQPTPISATVPARVGTPGRLILRDVTRGVDLADLSGVYSVSCGQAPDSGGTASGLQFSFNILAKSRGSNILESSDPGALDGWHPSDASINQGIHRSYLSTVPFRNISQNGLHFGKTITYDSCTRDGLIAPEGNCCSRYRDNNGRCIAQSACIRAGLQPPVFGNLELAAQWCCSHVISPAGACR